jgi:hypothetical protein
VCVCVTFVCIKHISSSHLFQNILESNVFTLKFEAAVLSKMSEQIIVHCVIIQRTLILVILCAVRFKSPRHIVLEHLRTMFFAVSVRLFCILRKQVTLSFCVLSNVPLIFN